MSVKTDAFGKPIIVAVPSSPLVTQPVSVVVDSPVGTEIFIPVAVKNSIGHKIEDIEGQPSKGKFF